MIFGQNSLNFSLRTGFPARSDGEGEREGKSARESQNRQCSRPKFRRKVLIGGYILIHDVLKSVDGPTRLLQFANRFVIKPSMVP